jgi:hypothetical protein
MVMEDSQAHFGDTGRRYSQPGEKTAEKVRTEISVLKEVTEVFTSAKSRATPADQKN